MSYDINGPDDAEAMEDIAPVAGSPEQSIRAVPTLRGRLEILAMAPPKDRRKVGEALFRIMGDVTIAPVELDSEDFDLAAVVLTTTRLIDNIAAATVEPAKRTQVDAARERFLAGGLTDAAWARDLLEVNAASLCRVAEGMLGSHGYKLIHPQVSAAAALMSEAGLARGQHPFVASSTTHLRLRLAGGGNAGQNRHIGFLAATVLIAGKPRSVAEEIAEDGPLGRAFRPLLGDDLHGRIRAGLTGNVDRLGDQLAGCGANEVDLFLPKVLLWPLDGCGAESDYLQVTPVRSDGLEIEKNCRVRERRQAGGHFDTKDLKVGGSKPQNAGFVANRLRGKDLRLRALPMTTRRQTLIERLRERPESVLSLAPLDRQGLAELGRLARCHANNDAIRRAMERCVGWAIGPVLTSANGLRKALAELEGEPLSTWLAAIESPAERRFLDPGRKSALLPEEKHDLALRLADRLILAVKWFDANRGQQVTVFAEAGDLARRFLVQSILPHLV